MRYIVLALAALVLLGGCGDGEGNDIRVARPSVSPGWHGYRWMPGPPVGAIADVTSTAPPVPGPEPTDAPEQVVPEPQPTPNQAPPQPAAEPERPPEPAPEPAPAGGTLVYDVPLTVYTCHGDSTGAYCPGDPVYCGGTVYRGVAACGWQWSCGQRFRIVGDPLDMVYTCLDRGGMVTGIDVWFMDYYAEGKPWRVQVRASYESEHVTVELLP